MQTCAELDALGVANLGVVCDVQQRDDDRRDGGEHGRAIRSRRLPRQQRADVPADGADRGGERTRPRRVLHVRGEGIALGDAGRASRTCATQGWGRIVNFASSMGITGGRGFAAYNASKEAIRGADAYRGARVGARRHRRQRDRAGGGGAPRRGRQAERGLPDLHRELPDGTPRRPRARHRRASRGSCAATAAATSRARRSWSTAARSCGRDPTRSHGYGRHGGDYRRGR